MDMIKDNGNAPHHAEITTELFAMHGFQRHYAKNGDRDR